MNSNTYALGKIEVTQQSAATSQRKVARMAGLLYLTIIFAGIFAEFFVRQSLIVPGNASATAGNILASESLFRMGIAADLIMIICDVALALAFYLLLEPVNRSLALLAAFFRLAQATVLGINLLNLFSALQLLSGANYLKAFGADQLYAQAMLDLNAHATGYSLGLVFFGLSVLILGYLIVRSGYIPGILGILLIFASAGYLVDSFAKVLMPNYDSFAAVFALIVFVPALIGELALGLWLLIKGVRDQDQPLKASETA